jgi:hypothetical protein
MEGEKVIAKATIVVNEILRIRKESQDEVTEKLYKILEDSKEVFEKIGNYQQLFLQDELRSLDFYAQALDQLTGCYFYLNPITEVLAALEKNRSLNYFHVEKVTLEKAGTKFVSAPVEKESENFVSEERYVLAIFQGFLDNCVSGIQSCRARLKNQTNELELNK